MRRARLSSSPPSFARISQIRRDRLSRYAPRWPRVTLMSKFISEMSRAHMRRVWRTQRATFRPCCHPAPKSPSNAGNSVRAVRASTIGICSLILAVSSSGTRSKSGTLVTKTACRYSTSLPVYVYGVSSTGVQASLIRLVNLESSQGPLEQLDEPLRLSDRQRLH